VFILFATLILGSCVIQAFADGLGSDSQLTIRVSVTNASNIEITNVVALVNKSLIPDALRDKILTLEANISLADKIESATQSSGNITVVILDLSESQVEIPISLTYYVVRQTGENRFHLTRFAQVELPLRQAYVDVEFLVGEPQVTTRLQWVSPEGSVPTPRIEMPIKPFAANLVRRSVSSAVPSANLFYVLIESSIYVGIESSVWQYVADVTYAFSVEVYTVSGASPADLRDFLRSGWSRGLSGCILVGDLPVAWYEIAAHDGWGYEQFPIDLYYMDLDGHWSDADFDGVWDGHMDSTPYPEIWIGRLKASGFGLNQIDILNNYFRKNHDYRLGKLSVSRRALVYVDDDWAPSSWVAPAVGLLYSNTLAVDDPATTKRTDYLSRIVQGYEWVQLLCHGWSGGHVFKIPVNIWEADPVYSSDYLNIDPPVLFYNFFTCSGARYTDANYLAGAAIFGNSYGLLAVGSTKTGSMLYFEDFYSPLSTGYNVGESFRQWFGKRGEESRDWFYGMCIIGDPTLTTPPQGGSVKAMDAPSVAVSSGRLFVAIRGVDNGVYVNSRTLPAGVWSGWQLISGGYTLSSPALAASTGRLDMVVRGTNNGIYHIYWTSTSGWSGSWRSVGGLTNDRLTLAVLSNRVYAVVRGVDNGVYCNSMDLRTNAWSGWYLVSAGYTLSAPALAASSSRLDIVVRGTDNNIYHAYMTGGGWSGWRSLPGATYDAPAVCVAGGKLFIAVRGTDNGVYAGSVALTGGSWSGWVLVSKGYTISPAGLTASSSDMILVVRGTDSGVYQCSMSLKTSVWSGWRLVSKGYTLSPPGLAVSGNQAILVVRGTDNSVYCASMDLSTNVWSEWSQV